MGLIQQQTIKGSVYSFIGVILGFVNLVILSPIIFTTDQIGLTQVMIAIATILAQVGSLGFNNVTNRLFPYFRAAGKGHNGYLSLAFLVTAAGFILCMIGLIIYMPSFIEGNREKSELLSEYAWYIPVLLAFLMLFTLLDNYAKVLFKAVLGTFLHDFVLRLIILFILLAFYFKMIDFSTYVLLFVLAQAVPSLIIIVYLLGRGEFRFRGFRDFITPDFARQIISLSVFGIIAGLSTIALTTIDKYLVNSFNGLGDAGIYSIAVYFATLIIIPSRSLGKIAVPVVSEAWKSNDMKVIQDVYYKSSINQMLVGLLIFVGISANLDNIFRILPPEYAKGGMVIIFFGLANIVSASAGACKIILSTSSYYRYQTYLMVIFIVLVVASNLLLIPAMGITGAAVASLISMFIYTALTVLALRKFYGLWPFTRLHILVLVFSAVIYLAVGFLPEMQLIPDILLRSLLIVVAFTIVMKVFRISDDASLLFDTIIKYLRRKN
ncbi:MAG: polysaccharide biosynthesis C-terminal domain-containing protein [Bacteroidales bacterium]|nr:polysaccharide biosynthesis C-terminal domain-containing protein [Bacteroidales bacterium]